MSNSGKNNSIALALVERFDSMWLPRALEIRQRMDEGEILMDFDISFLKGIVQEAINNKHYADEMPELHKIYAQAVALYHEITEKALANEKKNCEGVSV